MVNGTVQIEDQQYTIQPVFADRLTYVLQRNYDKARDPFVSYFGYESVTNCTDPTTINWSEKCSRMGFICSDEIDSFREMTLRIVLNLMRLSYISNSSPTSVTNIDMGKHIKVECVFPMVNWSEFRMGQ